MIETSSVVTDLMIRVARDGAVRAGRGLSGLVGQEITIHVPSVRMGTTAEACNEVGGGEAVVLGAYLQISGDISGHVMLLFPVNRAVECADLMCGNPVGTTTEPDDLVRSLSNGSAAPVEKANGGAERSAQRFGLETALDFALGRRILEELGGEFRTEANRGGGETLVFSYAAPGVAAEAPAVEENGSGRVAHILVVDDNATNRMVAETLCEMFDCTSEVAVDGVEAVEAARTGRFDLILMDIKMPRMDGVAATREIRQLAGRPGQRNRRGKQDHAHVIATAQRRGHRQHMQELMPAPDQDEAGRRPVRRRPVFQAPGAVRVAQLLAREVHCT